MKVCQEDRPQGLAARVGPLGLDRLAAMVGCQSWPLELTAKVGPYRFGR